MNLADLAIYALIVASVIVLALALIPARRVYREAGELSRSWLALVVLIVVFIAAYVLFGFFIGADIGVVAGLTVAGLLFGSACFILIACGLSEAGFHELRRLAALERHRANHDDLTGLPNRSAFMAHLHRVTHDADGQRNPAVLIADLDHFRTLNDTVGHQYGDILLQEAAMRLRRVLRKDDVVARLGGDEFGVLVRNVHGRAGLEAICRNLTSALERPFAVEGHIADMGMSVGA
ncbi:MAG: diguanylate cyclase domain-containing protein, partial [Gammaproteobacteria bacterium]